LPTENTTFEKLLSAFDTPGVVAAFGRQLPYRDATLFAKHLRAFNYPKESYIRSFEDREKYGLKTAFLSDSFSAYKKSAMEDVGWFKEGTIFGEDMHLVARMLINGGKVAYVAEAAVYHSHNYTIAQDFRRYFDTGVFHSRESWLMEKFGKAEGEGKRYVFSELNYLMTNGAYLQIPEFFLRNAMKLLGYKIGRNYKKLPLSLAITLSMHKSWWKRWL
jgi:rhamnosyltransferase